MPLQFIARAACDHAGCTHTLDLPSTSDGLLDVAEQLEGIGWGIYALTATDTTLPWSESWVSVRCPDHQPLPDEPATADTRQAAAAAGRKAA